MNQSVASSFAVVVLAGGRAERLGQPKGLVTLAGESWLRLQQRVLSQVTSLPPIVVTGDHSDAYERDLGTDSTWHLVRNPEPEFGPFSSLQTGISAALSRYPDLEGIFVLPVDTPAPVLAVWRALADRLHSRRLHAVIPTRPDINPSEWQSLQIRPSRSGHPVCLSAAFCRQLLAIDKAHEKARLDVQLGSLGDDLKQYVDVNDYRAFLNLNSKVDWAVFGPMAVPSVGEPLMARPRHRGAMICRRGDELLAISAREPVSGMLLSFPPGGGIEGAESPDQTALREVWEETGFRTEIVSMEKVIARYFFPWNGVLYDLITHFFLGCLAPDGHRAFAPDDPAIEGIRWVPMNSIETEFGFLPPLVAAIKRLLRGV